MLPKSILNISQKAPISHVTEIPTTDKIVHIKIGKNLSITQDGILNAADVVVPNAAEADIIQSIKSLLSRKDTLIESSGLNFLNSV